MSLNRVYLIRHGQTAWTLSGQHTGMTDIPLTKKGEEDAILIGKRLQKLALNLKTAVRDGKVMQDFESESLGRGDTHSQLVKGSPRPSDSGLKDCIDLPSPTAVFRLTKVLCSPLKRALITCKNAGLLNHAEIDPLLVEWNYGEFEGMTSPEIWEKSPQWNIFSNGAPKGESVQEISSRADQVLKKIQSIGGDVALFSHGHFLRVLTARWLQLTADQGRLFALDPSSLSILGFERTTPVVQLWNSLYQK